MKVQLANGIEISDEASASSYGIPVAVFEGQAYGPSDDAPEALKGQLGFFRQNMSIFVAENMAELNHVEADFVRRFFV